MLRAVLELPLPHIPRGATSSKEVQRQRFLGNVHELMLDTTSRVLLLVKYHEQLCRVTSSIRRTTANLTETLSELDEVMHDLCEACTDQSRMPYFKNLCRDFPSQL